MLGGARVLCIQPNLAGHSCRSRPGALLRRGARLVVPGGTQQVDRYGVEYSPRSPSRPGHRSLSSAYLDHVGAHLGANACTRGWPQIETSQRMTGKNVCRDTGLLAGGRARTCRNPQSAIRNHKRVAEAHIAAAAPPTKRNRHHQPATTSLPMVLPLSRRRCASRSVCALIGESVSVWVVRSSPASIRLAARLRMRCCSTMSSVA